MRSGRGRGCSALLPHAEALLAMAAEAEAAAAAADLGPGLGISPETPSIVRKRGRPSRKAGRDGSCCTALFTSAATEAAAGPGKADSDGSASVSPVQEQSQSAPEDLGQMDCAPVSTQESSTSPLLVGETSDKVAQQEQKQQQEEGLASGSEGGAAPVPTPEKVEPTPRRLWKKKSTKGVLRFKVVKDKVMKPKMTLKTATPRKVKKDKKQQTPEDGRQHDGAASSSRTRRKLDLDSSQSKTCFSRAELTNNLKCLAKSHGLNAEPSQRKRSKRGRKRKQMILAHQGTPTGASSSALVPLRGSAQLDIARQENHGKRLSNKVLGLNEETLRVCDVLAKWDRSDSESFEGFDIGSGPEWDQTRRIFECLVDIFIAEMLDLMGPRKFSPWGGSLIDSVVGTFLTQNVADNLSSHAFMNLAAKFSPRKKRCHKVEDCSNTAFLVDGVDENLNPNEAFDTFDSVDSDFDEYYESEEEDGHDTEAKGHYGEEYNRLIENFIANMKAKGISAWDSDLINLVKDKSGNPVCTERTLRKFMASLRPVPASTWKELREEAYRKGYSDRSRTSDAVDWESVLHAPLADVAKCIEVRGQHYILALRIQVFLMHVKNAQDGSFDLDWLRYISREKAKNFLLSIHGIGVKSADCIRLLSLRHKAFPVDVNVARIVTRLGWVKLQPLNGAEFHLINSYPIMRDVQRYLWPRLCTIDKEKLYELHCLMITFGKVMCTKVNPNCSACPFSAKCKYYNSSLARKSLPPPPEKHEDEHGEQQSSIVASGRFLLSNDSCMPSSQHMYQHQIEITRNAETPPIQNCEPIVEMPQSPEHEYKTPNEQKGSYEDYLCDLEDIVPEGVQYDGEIDLCSIKHVPNNRSWTPKCGKDLIVINPNSSLSPNKKLKNVGRLRTEHNAYVLPDDHVILEEFEERVPEDICPYLLVVVSCPDDYTVEGTVLIPCRTANQGKFPLNGTYFQANEVFADHSSSRRPITIPRECIGMLDRSIVYFGSSIHSITRGQTRCDIEECFKEGYVCVRGFHRRTRTPMRLCSTLHAINTIKKEAMKKEGDEKHVKRARTSPEGKSQEKKASSAN